MMSIARLVAFDLRRFRMPIAVMAGLELARAAFGEWVLHRAPVQADEAFSAFGAAFEFPTLDGTLWLATAIVTAIVVQSDHPADDRGFLRSRPVGPWTLASAKLTLLAALFVLLPFVATALRLVAYGAPVASIGACALQFVIIGGAVALPAWALALATRTLPLFLLASAAGVVSWGVAKVAFSAMGWRTPFDADTYLALTAGRIPRRFTLPLADWQWVDDRGWLVALAITLLAAGLLVSYYSTRRAVASAVAATALIAAPAVIPKPVPASVAASPELVAVADGGLRLEVLWIPSPSRTSATRREPVEVRGDLRLSGLPANVSMVRRLGRVHLTGPGFDLRTAGIPALIADAGRASAAAARSTEPVQRLDEGDLLFPLEPRDIERLRGRRVHVEASVDLRFTRHDFVADLPLRAGVAFRTDVYLVEILSVDVQPRLATARCRVTRFPSLTRSGPHVSTFIGHPDGPVVRAYEYPDRAGFNADVSDERRVGWAYGRTWTREVHLPIPDLASSIEPRLRIVESRPAGGTPGRLVARDVPVREW